MDTLRIEATNKEGNKIGPVDSCQLLGVQVARNMKWNVQIETHRDSVLKKIRKKAGCSQFCWKVLVPRPKESSCKWPCSFHCNLQHPAVGVCLKISTLKSPDCSE